MKFVSGPAGAMPPAGVTAWRVRAKPQAVPHGSKAGAKAYTPRSFLWGKAVAATRTIIPEEFRNRPVTLDGLCDILLGAILKRRSLGATFGVAVLAAGLREAVGARGCSRPWAQRWSGHPVGLARAVGAIAGQRPWSSRARRWRSRLTQSWSSPITVPTARSSFSMLFAQLVPYLRNSTSS